MWVVYVFAVIGVINLCSVVVRNIKVARSDRAKRIESGKREDQYANGPRLLEIIWEWQLRYEKKLEMVEAIKRAHNTYCATNLGALSDESFNHYTIMGMMLEALRDEFWVEVQDLLLDDEVLSAADKDEFEGWYRPMREVQRRIEEREWERISSYPIGQGRSILGYSHL